MPLALKILPWAALGTDWGGVQHAANHAIFASATKPHCIFGVPRGGLPIAVGLSHHLNLPLVLKPTAGMLIVDDIYDTGQTIDNLLAHYPDSKAVVWLFRDRGRLPNIPHNVYGVRSIPLDEWVVFPWESPIEAHKEHVQYLAARGLDKP